MATSATHHLSYMSSPAFVFPLLKTVTHYVKQLFYLQCLNPPLYVFFFPAGLQRTPPLPHLQSFNRIHFSSVALPSHRLNTVFAHPVEPTLSPCAVASLYCRSVPAASVWKPLRYSGWVLELTHPSLLLSDSSLSHWRKICVKTLQALRSLWWKAVKLHLFRTELDPVLKSKSDLEDELVTSSYSKTYRLHFCSPSTWALPFLFPNIPVLCWDVGSFRIWENTVGAHILNSLYSLKPNSGWEGETED